MPSPAAKLPSGPGIEMLPASVYIDPDRYEAEQRKIFDKVPHLLAPSALLPETRQAVAHDGYGTPLILTRDDDGKAHVFANVCRHRGTRLIDSQEPVAAKRIVCPYHAWAYKPDGELTGMPRADCFPDLDKASHGLREFPCVEAGGLIWWARTTTPISDAKRGPDLDAFGLADLICTSARRTTWPATGSCSSTPSSKAIMCSGCTRTPLPPSSPTASPPPTRSASTSARWWAPIYLAEIDRDDWSQLRKALTYTYQLFPASVIIVSPDYINCWWECRNRSGGPWSRIIC